MENDTSLMFFNSLKTTRDRDHSKGFRSSSEELFRPNASNKSFS